MEDSLEKPKALRMRYIERIDDLLGAIELCDTYKVPDNDLDTLEEFKDRLKAHYYAQKHGNFKKKVRLK